MGVPTGAQAVQRRQTIPDISTITPLTTILPEIIEHGPLDDASIDSLVAKITGGSLAARSELHARQTTSTNGPFLSYINGQVLPGSGIDPDCADFQVEGPIIGIEAAMGSSNIVGLKLTSIAGNSTTLAGTNQASPAPGAFQFDGNERITEFIVKESDFNQVLGFTFKTDAGKSYSALSLSLTDSASFDITAFKDKSIPVGSGIIARIRGTKCPSILGSFGIDFLDDLSSIAISNISYSGFTNNIAPSGPGSVLTVGSQILDNRNSSIQQQMSLITSDATTVSSSITTALSWKVGGSVAVKTGAEIPFLVKSEVTATASWEVNPSKSDTELTQTTVTNSATFQLNCPAKKFCVGSATFQTFKLSVSVEATFSAVTKSGNSYNWVQKGTYNGSDSLAMKLTIDEVDPAST
ncbi:hypothetical protein DL95DRAFT_375918 [Leptodontidium sp. 2 PMI_412]|nr:hypothetical protein DL95DRAFT_375918 [Leptodontidium sp. 2 PMI_412]